VIDSKTLDLKTDRSYTTPKELDPIKLLSIDRWILISIVALAVLACRMLLKSPGSKEAALIYEQAHTILPPLAM
jgi:hypothetical protein